MTTIVFSKDRALQLEAFLRSYRWFVRATELVQVIALATSEVHRLAYDDVFSLYPWAVRWTQCEFKQDLLSLLPRNGNVVFFVNDQVFVRSWDSHGEPGLSLRLGLHLTRNYASGDSPQKLPPHWLRGDGLVEWNWIDGEMAWRYPLSLDGHVFDVVELRAMLTALEFNSPNTLESAMQERILSFLTRRGTCYLESKVVNVPWNRVQTDWENRCAGVASADEMLAHWNCGMRIDLSNIYGVLNESVHQEFPLMLEPRRR